MALPRVGMLIGAFAALVSGAIAQAHGIGGHGGATAVAAFSKNPGAQTQVAVAADPEAAQTPIIPVARGAHVHLSVHGTGASALHLHGYDIAAQAEHGQPAVFEFHAVHNGRFAVKMHVVDDLLGAGEKAVLFIEVREP